ncbi:hypothetical protein [Ancylobacter terrae]|uniref:hypothetical protein n=1 Tax=Ancylobacter sp. sgz301288 TaxID=3342077 RepID=UPI00385AD0EB
MRQGAPSNANPVDPRAWEAMQEAARQAGMPLDEWLRARVLGTGGMEAASPAPAPSGDANLPAEPPAEPHRGSRTGPRQEGLISALDSLNRRIGALLSEPARGEGGTAGSFLRRRPEPQRPEAPASSAFDRRLGEIVRTVETLNKKLDVPETSMIAPGEPALDAAVAEITAHQRALEAAPSLPEPPVPAEPEPAPARSGDAGDGNVPVNLSGLERQLNLIADQMQELRNAIPMGTAIDALHADVAEMKRALGELAPRSVVEELENAIAVLTARLDDGSDAGGAKAEMARALGELGGLIEGLRPPESHARLAEDIEALTRKIDIVNAKTVDGATIARLQAQTAELREIIDRTLSMDAVRLLAEQIEALVVKIDRIASPDENLIRHVVATLESRIDALGAKIDAEATARADFAPFGDLNRRLDELQASVAGAVRAAPEGMEALLQGLVERVERLGRRKGGAEDGSTDRALAALEQQLGALADRIGASMIEPGQIANIERGLGDLFIQMEEARASAVAAAEKSARDVAAEFAATLPTDGVAAIRRNLADLESRQETTERRTFDTLEAVHETLERVVDRIASLEQPGDLPVVARTEPYAAPLARSVIADAAAPISTPDATEPAPDAPQGDVEAVSTDEVRLPDDYPLEPGSGDPRQRPSAWARVAQSEAALQELALRPEESPQRADFIAAARRAAQSAAGQPASSREDGVPRAGSRLSRLFTRARLPLLIAVSSAAMALVALQLIGGLRGNAPRTSSAEPAATTADPSGAAAIPTSAAPAQVVTVAPATPPRGLQPTADAMANAPSAGLVGIPDVLAQPASPLPGSVPAPAGDITGSIPPAATPAAPGTGNLPEAVGSASLRSAAIAGNQAAAYEIGARFAEGRGVSQDLARAAYWFEQATAKGSAPAAYRLAALLDKGADGVIRDTVRARKLYAEAAEAGNVRAMHNLAVLLAEGVNGQPDYKQASDWFLKAAERGVRDSQYNLGVLYARGLGVKADLAESWKWFSLAANQGDAEAARKRDEVETRLAKPTLVAARFAVQTWSPMMTDDAANIVAANPDWDKAEAPQPVKRKTASRS